MQAARGQFKLFGDLKEKIESPRAATQAKSDNGSLQRAASPIGMPYFHELKEIQKQVTVAFPQFPQQRH